ncbi:NAD(P)H-quinone oxidoreductase [Variovorax sp. 770b2]|uniref:NAD(P)H-quinone oxidoreductase n=1 Tax=Variovorax sp. 770b2 TaxID=1566271 RepID=UPI0008F304BC|nr:NAD(P)H-quinone oxidoreductase [Variovorax sp. 770b2]SFQ05468.1 putative NAD(P)H quinone oxidoreductase, PIG3 family [Variovorax sp. 770b2]
MNTSDLETATSPTGFLPSLSMNSVIVDGGSGNASALRVASTSMVVPAVGQLLIRVKAAGVNRPDIMQRTGLYPAPTGASKTLGLEVAGEVVGAAGRWRVGDKVCALVPGGGYAEYAVCDPRHALRIPRGLSFEEAAGLPETAFTVWANVFEHGELKSGDTFLVHGATSGIGVMAIQMAKAAGAKVIASARSAEKANKAKELGADVVIDTSSQNFTDVVRREGGADVVLDMVGGAFFEANVLCMKPGGRLVFISALAGARVELDIFQLMQKRLTVTGSTLRPRSDDEKARISAEVEAGAWPWLDAGIVIPCVSRTFWLEDADLAHEYLEAGKHVGKVILSVRDRSQTASK